MHDKGRLSELLDNKAHQRIVLGICVLLILVLEVMIYLSAANTARQISTIIVTDHSGRKVYEAPGSTLTSYQQMLFEETHGPLADYNVYIKTDSHPFPTRTWLSSAAGIPIGLILLMVFLVRVFMALVHGESTQGGAKESTQPETGRFGSSLALFRGISVFHAGLLFLVGALLLWLVPEFLLNVVEIGVSAVREFTWVVVGLAVFLALIIMWVVYLRYRLSKYSLDNQFGLEKVRLEHQPPVQAQTLLLPDNRRSGSGERDLS